MNSKQQHGEQERVPSTKRKVIPLRMAKGPQDYVPDQQEEPAVLTSVADMLGGEGGRLHADHWLPASRYRENAGEPPLHGRHPLPG